MIIVRIGFVSDAKLSEIAGSDSANGPSTLHFAERTQGRTRRATGVETKSLAIELTQYVETDADTASLSDKAAMVFAGTSSDQEERMSKRFAASVEP